MKAPSMHEIFLVSHRSLVSSQLGRSSMLMTLIAEKAVRTLGKISWQNCSISHVNSIPCYGLPPDEISFILVYFFLPQTQVHIEFCYCRNPNPKKNPGSALSSAVHGNHAEIVYLLLDHGADPNHYDPQRGSALLQAAISGNRLITYALLDAGADVDAEDYEFGTPLIASVSHDISDDVKPKSIMNSSRRDLVGKPENVTDILLKAGADVNISGPKGTALLLACNSRNPNVADLIIKSSANPCLALCQERTPLLAAVKSGNAQVVQIMLANGADANETNNKHAPLHEACSVANHSITKLLLDRGADPHVKAAVSMQQPNSIIFVSITKSRQALHAACAVKTYQWYESQLHPMVEDTLLWNS